MIKTSQYNAFVHAAGHQTSDFPYITRGVVIDTNDPQGKGRFRAVCPRLGDIMQSPIEDIPWALYASPFAGSLAIGTRGSGVQTTEGDVAYGLWAPPKIGSTVLIACIDGDPKHRVFQGNCLDHIQPHTLPHGRWFYEDHPALDKSVGNNLPLGPYSSREKPIQPLADNIKQAFGDQPSIEKQTRAADYTASRVSVETLSMSMSSVPDDDNVRLGNWVSTQGYQTSRFDPFAETTVTDKNYDNQVISLTTPGFHAISFDDRQENCRIKFRTTSGHQIIMDDTNERIYISTAKGENWVELDQNGNIDVFSTNKVSIHSAKSLNLSSDEDVRIYGKQGVHLRSDTSIYMAAIDTIELTTQTLKETLGSGWYLAAPEANIQTSADMFLTAGGIIHERAGDSILATAGQIHMNGSREASPASTDAASPAAFTSRIPQHEPWPRGMTADDQSSAPEQMKPEEVNRKERNQTYVRGYYWRP